MTTQLRISTTDRLRFEEVAFDAAETLRRHYGMSQHVNFLIKWDLKGNSRTGMTTYRQGYGDITIRLNPGFAAVLAHHYDSTVQHEVAHVVTEMRRRAANVSDTGRWSSHGAEWAGAMRALGLSPDRCAVTPEKRAAARIVPPARKSAPVNRVLCHCDCREMALTVIRANKITRGTASYRCQKCRTTVKVGPKPGMPALAKFLNG